MIHYRSFRNSDPPALAEIWRAQPPAAALIQPATPALLDELVFSKPYFRREGLILAFEEQTPVGRLQPIDAKDRVVGGELGALR